MPSTVSAELVGRVLKVKGPKGAEGKVLIMNLGFSHEIRYNVPQDVEVSIEKMEIKVSGINKQRVGQVAAEIREFKKPEPYKGKGIKYKTEKIVRKAGKSSK